MFTKTEKWIHALKMLLASVLSVRVLYKFQPFGAANWFAQRVDHFTPNSTALFAQRYFQNETFYDRQHSSPLIIYIGGEAELYASSLQAGPITEIANATNAVILGLEHRFFGQSHPFNSYNATTLRYLTVGQALADLTNFIHDRRSFYCQSQACPVLVIGGSYAGSLASWYRLYYPHVANFAWASSAPVHIKTEFPDYDAKVARVLNRYGEDCFIKTKLLLSRYHHGMVTDPVATVMELNRTFGFPLTMNRTSMLEVLVDVIDYPIQYNEGYNMIGGYCSRILAGESVDTVFSALFRDVMKRLNSTVTDLDPLSPTCLTDDSWNSSCADTRAWTWITCNELGWFGTSAGFQSPWINMTYNGGICQQLFGLPPGNISNVANRYGGAAPGSSYVVFSQGTADPWSTVGVRTVAAANAQFLYRIEDAAHCADLHSPRPNDSGELKKQRSAIVEKLIGWLGDQCGTNCQNGKCLNDECVCDVGWSGTFCDTSVVDSQNFMWIGLTALMMPLLILISVGGSAWWLVRGIQEERFLLAISLSAPM
jgi:serine protease 16